MERDRARYRQIFGRSTEIMVERDQSRVRFEQKGKRNRRRRFGIAFVFGRSREIGLQASFIDRCCSRGLRISFVFRLGSFFLFPLRSFCIHFRLIFFKNSTNNSSLYVFRFLVGSGFCNPIPFLMRQVRLSSFDGHSSLKIRHRAHLLNRSTYIYD